MRKTKRNIARKPKAAKANRIPAKTEPFASAEGHTSHSKATEPPQTSAPASTNGASQKFSHAHAMPANRDAPVVLETEPFASAEGHASHSEITEPLQTSTTVRGNSASEKSSRPHGPVHRDALSTRQTEPFASAEGPGSPSTNDVPSLSQSSHGANGASGFVSQSRQGTGLPSFANSAADTRNPAPDTSDSDSDSDPRAERNRQNAQRSTGPRTPEGKAASSQNARKHGLSIQRHVILDDEDPADYEQLLAELREIYEPQTRREDLSVEDVAQCRWALQRFDEAEATALTKETSFHTQDPEDPATVGEALAYIATTLIDLDRRDRRIVQPDTHYPAFEKIQRYRAHWDRRHHRALAEFDRAQRARRQDARDERQQVEATWKAEREAAAECRRQELHELRIALAQEKLVRERQRHAKAGQATEDQALHQALEDFLQSPPPGLANVQLGSLGFVSQMPYDPVAAQAENFAPYITQSPNGSCK